MAKIKLSKTELKRQRDMLKRFTRFLPTLQLKKQQLQMEILRVSEELAAHQAAEQAFEQGLRPWIELMSSTAEFAIVPDLVTLDALETDTKNIAGVDIPVFKELRFAPFGYDLFLTPAWVDSGVKAIQDSIVFQARRRLLEIQMELLREELRTTTQRVNLFEKVKIPQAKENIRKIRIYLGDQQTAAVGRAKIAKGKIVATAEAGQ
jgi:V/A-type H+-transporting ATPase subunit D